MKCLNCNGKGCSLCQPKKTDMGIAGYGGGKLICDGPGYSCGRIRNGIGFHFENEGGWVMPFETLEKIYLQAKATRNVQPRSES